MRDTAAPILLASSILLCGLGVLQAIRPRPREGRRGALTRPIAAAGLAYLLGLSVILSVTVCLIVLGVAISFGAVVLIALVAGFLGWAIGARRARPRQPRPDPHPAIPFRRADRLLLLGCAILFGAFALASLPEYASAPTVAYDSWAIWTLKAIALFDFGTLVPEIWTSPGYTAIHQEYPIMLPALESLHFEALGRVDTQSVHLQLWFLLLAFPWALSFLAADAGRAAIWAPIALGAATAPAIITEMVSGYADVPLIVFLAPGVLALGLWVDEGDRADLALATVLLIGAAGIKQEGLIISLVAFAAAAIIRVRSWPRLRELAVAAAAYAVGIAPWQLWVSSQEIQKEIEPRDALDPGNLLDRADRLWPSLEALSGELLDQSRWSFLVPLAIVAAAAALLSGRASRAAGFYLLSGAGSFLAVVWSFWVAPAPVSFYGVVTAPRVVGVVAAIAIAALIHLAPRLAGPARAGDAGANRHTARRARSAHTQPEQADEAFAGGT